MEELEVRFAELKKEYDSIQDEKRIAEEKEKKLKDILEKQTKAVILIQAYWRGFAARKDLKKLKKGKKSAGSGKKKK